MRHHYFNKHLRRTLMAAAIAAPGLLFAGNVPQYQVSKGANKYAEFSDGIKLTSAFNGIQTIFPGGVETPNAKTAEGFPIGFDYRLGGTTFNQFVVSNNGDVYFGKDVVAYGSGAFRVSMSPVTFGILSATISYKVTGEAGNQVLNIQYKNAVLNENKTYKGEYSLQLRFFESDGHIEIAFKEIDTARSAGVGFDLGIHGWDGKDAIQVTAEGLDKELSVSPYYAANMLVDDSYVHWDKDDYDNFYKPVYVFTPISDTPAPSESPLNFKVVQDGNKFKISCDKAPSAEATVILCSAEPFSNTDMPVDGETFRGAYYDSKGNQIIPTSFGNAKALYYGNEENISLTLDNVIDGQDYYFLAMSTNGYPAYGRNNAAEVKIATSQAAPNNFIANAASASSIDLAWSSDYPVIIASTTEVLPGYQQGYKGVFGTPDANAKVGDEISGGGKVIYVGDAKNLTVDTEVNALTFFRIWSVNGNSLSATAADAAAVTTPSFPYEPGVEYYPFGEKLMGWEASEDQYIPWTKQYDQTNVLRAISINGNVVSLQTPALDLSLPTHISFEYSLETIRPADDQGVPQGNKPGVFGTGSLNVSAGGKTYKSVSSYDGTMTECPDGYESGSSTFEIVELDMDAIGKDEKVTFSFSTNADETSYLYLRNIKIERIGEAPLAPELAPANVVVKEDENAILYFSCDRAEDAEYTLVLFSEKPITSDDYPEDGVAPAVGSKIGDAYVLYYGTDEKVECQTNYDIVIPDYNTPYYFAALSASGNPLYNRDNVANVEYTTATNGIDEVGVDAADMVIYNVMGIRLKVSRLGELPPGLYIVNGRKTIVK